MNTHDTFILNLKSFMNYYGHYYEHGLLNQIILNTCFYFLEISVSQIMILLGIF